MKKQVHYSNGALFSEVWVEDNQVKVELFHPVQRKFEKSELFFEHALLMDNTSCYVFLLYSKLKTK